jgi:hypothetical protein
MRSLRWLPVAVAACTVASLIVVAGCAHPVPAAVRTSVSSAVTPSTSTTTAANGVVLSLTVASTQLKADMSQVATLTLTNSSETTVDLASDLLLRITDDSGTVVYTTPVSRGRHPFNPTPLGPRGVRGGRMRFPVPVAGSYTLQGFVRGFPVYIGTVSIRFRSVG